ncbi:MAG: response regulator [Calditrichaeota bacterium]|nr:response regulator [Deltaproteobacteria bacterium]MBT4641579.1 response regulator [Deltaproteobacteria bacterium]MBT7618717.1 response regulator [Calditrichota bacterium]
MPEKKILLVDDDLVCLRFLRETLEKKYVLRLVQNGEEVLEILQSFRPDVVVLDVMMPGIDGFEVCQSLRNKKFSRNIKIVFASAKELPIEKRNDIIRRGDGYLLKPFGPMDLEHQIERIIAV